ERPAADRNDHGPASITVLLTGHNVIGRDLEPLVNAAQIEHLLALHHLDIEVARVAHQVPCQVVGDDVAVARPIVHRLGAAERDQLAADAAGLHDQHRHLTHPAEHAGGETGGAAPDDDDVEQPHPSERTPFSDAETAFEARTAFEKVVGPRQEIETTKEPTP